VSQLRDVGGSGTRTFDQATDTDRPATSTVRGRTVMNFDAGSGYLVGSAQAIDDIEDISGPLTISIVRIAPASVGTGWYCLFSSKGADFTNGNTMMLDNPSAGVV
jgi:hypothetical protein